MTDPNGWEINTRPGPLTIGATGYAKVEERLVDDRREYFRGDLAEIIIFDRALTEEELLGTRRYLRERYQLGA